MNFFPSLQLVLKHRQGKNHKMRIVVFVGSPVDADEKDVRHSTAMESFFFFHILFCPQISGIKE